jgi:hypothetical protein
MFNKRQIASFGTCLAAATGVAGLAATAPVATAGAQTLSSVTCTASSSLANATCSSVPFTLPQTSLVNFTPPTVGTICAIIGPIILGGKTMNPGVNVCTPPITGPTPTLPDPKPKHGS